MRPDWDEYFLRVARLASLRSTCLRRKVGSVIVRDNAILSTGYNGAPKGVLHCERTGCRRLELQIPHGERHEICRGIHAEQNAIILAAANGVGVSNATLYCTAKPCSICMKMIINAGIRTVYFEEPYDDPLSMALADEAGILVSQIKLPS